jgi:hypothetical protein
MPARAKPANLPVHDLAERRERPLCELAKSVNLQTYTQVSRHERLANPAHGPLLPPDVCKIAGPSPEGWEIRTMVRFVKRAARARAARSGTMFRSAPAGGGIRYRRQNRACALALIAGLTTCLCGRGLANRVKDLVLARTAC